MSQVKHQALRHGVDFIHIFERFKERSLTRTTQVALPENQDAGVLASYGDVHEQLMFDFMTVQVGTATM